MARATGRDRLRERLLFASLAHVPFDGWTRAALAAAVRDLKLEPAAADSAFPGGMTELVEFFNQLADRRMLEALEGRDLAALRVGERIAAAVRLRLEQNAPYREAMRRGLAFLALPQNAALGARLLFRTVNAIWYAAGDSSTDYNFYTKRALLAGVYAATVLYWLNDRSEGAAETWAFLDRRLADVMRVPRALGRLGKLAEKLPDPFRLFRRRSADETARRNP
ncbi:MAG: COQ9 family protein [Dongiaceae bacterium]